MKKTKFKVEIFANGNHSIDIIRMIGNHNSGAATITLEDIKGYVKSVAAKGSYTIDRNGVANYHPNSKKQILISDDEGINYYLAVTEVEILELADLLPDVLNQKNLS